MASDPVQLGPWRGVNNIEDELSPIYLPGETSAFLREAVNVDLTRDGWIRRRKGFELKLTLPNAHSGASVGGLFLVGTDDLLLVNGDFTTNTLASGVEQSQISYTLAGGQVYWCNAKTRGRIENKQGTFWGLDSPPIPTLTATATGSMPAGRYLVALTNESSSGIESGALAAGEIELTSDGGIVVSNIIRDPNAQYTNVYVSSHNGRDLFWADRISVSSYTLQEPAQSTDTLTTIGYYPPPNGAYIVRAFAGRLLVCAESYMAWSQPLAYHLFKLATDVQLFAEPIAFLEPLSTGFYIAEGNRTWWIEGKDPDTWQPLLVDTRAVVSNSSMVLPGEKIPALETSALVAVWATEDGFVAGLPGGQLRHLTQKTVAIDSHSDGSLLYREEDGIAQLIMGLRNKKSSSAFAATDRATIEVVKFQPVSE